MKKYFALCLIILIFAGNAGSQEIQWKVTEDAILYGKDHELEDVKIKKGDYVIAKYERTYPDPWKNEIDYVFYDLKYRDINADAVIPVTTKELFPMEITNKSNITLPYYNFDILFKQDSALPHVKSNRKKSRSSRKNLTQI